MAVSGPCCWFVPPGLKRAVAFARYGLDLNLTTWQFFNQESCFQASPGACLCQLLRTPCVNLGRYQTIMFDRSACMRHTFQQANGIAPAQFASSVQATSKTPKGFVGASCEHTSAVATLARSPDKACDTACTVGQRDMPWGWFRLLCCGATLGSRTMDESSEAALAFHGGHALSELGAWLLAADGADSLGPWSLVVIFAGASWVPTSASQVKQGPANSQVGEQVLRLVLRPTSSTCRVTSRNV